MNATMQDAEKKSLQIVILKRTHNRFKFDASELDLDMSELGQLLLDWFHEKAEGDEIPSDLVKAIDKYKKARDAGSE